jgi:hypothetical protein
MMRRSLRAAGLGRHEAGASSSDHQDPVSPPIAPPSWVPDPPAMDPGKSYLCVCVCVCLTKWQGHERKNTNTVMEYLEI